MGAIGFNCKAGKVAFKNCFDKCPLGSRCMPLPMLMEIGKQRVWKGKISTTQGLNGTREEWLKIVKDYFIDPMAFIFALFGTKTHAKLENKQIASLQEEIFEDDMMTGIADLLVEENGKNILYDYKTSGSFKVSKLLGIEKEKVADPSGAVYLKDSKFGNKGEPKMIDRIVLNPDKVDNWDYAMQLNRYRIFFEDAGIKVDEMYVCCIVRDGGTHIATSRGIEENFYKIPMPKIENKIVLEHYRNKSDALHRAIRENKCEICSQRETWDGIKCARYCVVAPWCNEIEGIETTGERTEIQEVDI